MESIGCANLKRVFKEYPELMRATHCGFVRLGVMLFLLCCIWTTSPMIVLGQTYYVNFVFNNSPYYPGDDSQSGSSKRENPKKHKPNKHESHDTGEISENDISDASDKCPNTDERCGSDHSSNQSWDIIEITPPSTRRTTKQTTKKPKKETTKRAKKTTTLQTPCATTPQTNQDTTTTGPMGTQETTTNGATGTSCFSTTPDGQISTSDTLVIELATTEGVNYTRMIEKTTTMPRIMEITTTITKWTLPTPRPSQCFEYPQAKCQEDMYLHEFFGIALQQDQGLAAKVSCEFQNEWSGPWLLMTRMELPVRMHTRHWFFGYLTDDYKDFNINLMSLAYIMNQMRLALLIIGQDNNNQLVYNLYDDFVISGFNDLFMLRKAHLVEANTTDLFYPSVGEVLETNTGHNRSCPFAVMGAWWGTKGYW